jgi:hypothetical protein
LSKPLEKPFPASIQEVAPLDMKRNLEQIVADIKNSRGPQLLLLFGDDLQVQGACKTLLDNLVPENQRGFNLERFDGRSAPWDQIEASLNTPPFFPGKRWCGLRTQLILFHASKRESWGEGSSGLERRQKDEALGCCWIWLWRVGPRNNGRHNPHLLQDR